MGAPAALLLGLGLLGAGAAFGAACLRPTGTAGFLLTAYVVGWTELVAVVFALSPFGLVTRTWLLLALAVPAVAAAVAWRRQGRPAFPSVGSTIRATTSVLAADPALATLAVLVAAGTAYVVALAFATPSLDFDSLLYHLPRAALWRQEHAVGYIDGASDPRLNGNPPGAEIGVLATMLLWGGDRFAALPQLLALGACCVATFGIALRIGLSRGAALFGALLVVTLPVVAVQAVTAYNDLVVAAFLAIAAYAALGRTRADLVLLALALGLALTTKPTAVLALPLLVLAAAVGSRPRRWGSLLAAAACGIALGAPWYVLNLAETGSLDGGLSGDADQRQPLALLEVATTARRHLYSLLDFSGTRSVDLTALYGVAALVVLVTGLAVAAARRDRRGVVVALGAAGVMLLPRALVEVAQAGMHVWVKGWIVLGRRDIADADASWEPQRASDAGLSWYGPLGAVLVTAALVLAILARRRGAVGWAPPVLAAAPFAFIGIFSVAVTSDPWRGRLLAFSVLLAAATWGLVLAHRWLAWGVVAIALVTLPLALLDTYGRPVGSAWLDQDRSVWSSSRQSLLAWRQSGSAAVAAGELLDREAGRETVAVAPTPGELVYPLLDPSGRRRTLLVPVDGGRVPADAGWLVVGAGSRVERCGTWDRVSPPGGWLVERRIAPAGQCEPVEGPR